MKNFDKKWLHCISMARKSRATDTAAPIEFAEKIIFNRSHVDTPNWQDVWFHASLKALAAMTSLLVISIYMHFHNQSITTFRPCIENAVAQVLLNL